MEIVAVDIGGTHARFALAEVEDGRVVSLGEPVKLKTAEHASFKTAWTAYGQTLGRPIPRHAGIAVATPIGAATLKFTNNPWTIHPATLDETLGIDSHVLVNDFAAVAHAVARLPQDGFRHICGPDVPLPEKGPISILGPGTGLGVAQLLRTAYGYHVIATEGGHIDFAPVDAIEDAILVRLRQRYRRVSVERIVCGPGLVNIYEALAGIENRAMLVRDDKTLWAAALDGTDELAIAAFERFCMSLGTVAGDIALAQGGQAVVIGGGIGQRIADRLPHSGFGQRFTAKGRFEAMMAGIPVKLILHPEPGLFGAAAAFSREHG
ncbi:glucokinase [Sphingomonas zeicaulis]|uniref:glucokinase n=1 Tax=Sphingomonas zeicaulis TaxID=1632740 RepID=UPI003D1BB29E